VSDTSSADTAVSFTLPRQGVSLLVFSAAR